MAMKLYVGKLPYSTTEDELREVFAAHGTVTSVAIIKDRDTKQSKGFGFVEFEKDEEAQAAIAALNNSDIGGRSIIVNVARPPEERPAGGNGGFNKRY
jgi:RNA recognition motif-containing protein